MFRWAISRLPVYSVGGLSIGYLFINECLVRLSVSIGLCESGSGWRLQRDKCCRKDPRLIY